MRASKPELTAAILKLLDALDRRKRKEGNREGPAGRPVPPGWKMAPDVPALPPPEEDEG